MRSSAVASHFHQICRACVLWDWVTALWSVSQTATGFVSAVHAVSRSGQTEASVINWKVMDWRQRWGRHYSPPASVMWNMGIPEKPEFRCMTRSALCWRNNSLMLGTNWNVLFTKKGVTLGLMPMTSDVTGSCMPCDSLNLTVPVTNHFYCTEIKVSWASKKVQF